MRIRVDANRAQNGKVYIAVYRRKRVLKKPVPRSAPASSEPRNRLAFSVLRSVNRVEACST